MHRNEMTFLTYVRQAGAQVRLLLVLALMSALVSCAKESEEPSPSDPTWTSGLCNGYSRLCDRRFDEVTFLMTHNAMSSLEDGWAAANQRYNVNTQLSDGVRGFMLDTYDLDGVPFLCHGPCDFGNRPLHDTFTDLRVFLEANLGEVIVLVFENYLSGEKMVGAFEEAGLGSMMHAQVPGDPWPTLREMIESGRRVVALTDDGGGETDWFMNVWDFAWETSWSIESRDQFTCEPTDRGSTNNDLFILNHFVTRPWANESIAAEVNRLDYLEPRAEGCVEESGQTISFVAVDFYAAGDSLEVVRRLNGLPE